MQSLHRGVSILCLSLNTPLATTGFTGLQTTSLQPGPSLAIQCFQRFANWIVIPAAEFFWWLKRQ